jgi:membrane-bound serine protease (ClpP class)
MNALDPLAWSILLMLLGCCLVVLEIFIPSSGLLGVLSAAAFIGSIYFAFQRGPTTGVAFLVCTVIAVPLVLGLAVKVWPHTPMGKAFMGELPSEAEVLPDDSRRGLVGKIGVARSKMLPSGAVEIEGHMIDAVSQGPAIEPGQYVVVVEVRSNRVVVRAAEEGEQLGGRNPDDVLSRPIDELGFESLDDPLA